MAAVWHENFWVELEPGQTVLDALLAQGVPIPHACRRGICQTCLLRAVEGRPPPASQQGLKASLRLQKHFLACICKPEESLRVVLPGAAVVTTSATVEGLRRLSRDVLELALAAERPLDYRAGQYLTLFRSDTEGRSYSLASVPATDELLHLHVRRWPGGRLSGWIHDELRVGQRVRLQGPAGDCFYVPGRPEQPLLLIGTGSGLAPLWAILRDALGQGHRGPIRLFHGSRGAGGLYLRQELMELARRHPQFDYVPCISGPDVAKGQAAGRAHDIALKEIPDLRGWRVFLCGHPEMVRQAQRGAYLAGASLEEIHSDAFHAAEPAAA